MALRKQICWLRLKGHCAVNIRLQFSEPISVLYCQRYEAPCALAFLVLGLVIVVLHLTVTFMSRVPFCCVWLQVIGTIDGSGRVRLVDKQAEPGTPTPVDLNLDQVRTDCFGT